MGVTTWNTAPDYDQWGIDTSWSCEDWIQWHKELKNHFGQSTANDIWNYAFANSGNLSSNLDCRTFNSSFRIYVEKNKLEPYANAGVFSPVLKTYGTVTDVFEGALSSVSSFFGGSAFKNVLNIALIGGVVFGGAYLYKSFKK